MSLCLFVSIYLEYLWKDVYETRDNGLPPRRRFEQQSVKEIELCSFVPIHLFFKKVMRNLFMYSYKIIFKSHF